MYLNFFDELYIAIDNPNYFYSISQKYKKYKTTILHDIPARKTIKLVLSGNIEAPNLYYMGREAAYNDRFYILDKKGLKLCLNPVKIFSETEICVETSFDKTLLMTLVESVILLRLYNAGIVPVHSCSIELLGKGIIFPAWGGIGKTRLILHLTSLGARYISDEWTLIRKNTLLPYDIEFNMLDYDLNEYADIVRLSMVDKARLWFNSKVASDKVRALLSRACLILNNKKYDPEDIFPLITSEAKLEKICHLQKWDNDLPRKDQMNVAELSDKMSLSFCRELRVFNYYYSMCKYALSDREEKLDNIYDMYSKKMSELIADKECFSLTLPAAGFRKHNLADMV